MSDYRYSLRAWAVATELSQRRADRRRRRLRRNQLVLGLGVFGLALAALVLVWAVS